MIEETLLGVEFVGRRRELHLFYKLIKGRLKSRVLVFHGIGGMGKSWLVSRLLSECKVTENLLHAYIDFSHKPNIDYLSLLTSVRDQIAPTQFATFNSVVSDYVHQMRTVYLGALPGSAASGIRVEVKDSFFSGSVGDIVGVKLENVHVAIPRDELKRIQLEMLQRTTESFLADLKAITVSTPAIFLFDTYERIEDPEFNRTTELAQWLRQELLREFSVSETPIYVVIARRRELTWQRQDREWRRKIHSVELKPFRVPETLAYVRKRRIGRGDVALRNSLYRLTQGHPQCVSLACDLIEDAQRAGTRITSEDFDAYRSQFDERLVSEFLIEGILSRLPEPMRYAVQVCAVPHRFDAQTIRLALNLESDGHKELDRITRYSFVYPSPEGGHIYHEIVRKLLLAKWRRDDVRGLKRIHEVLLTYLGTATQSAHAMESALQLERLYHQSYVREEAGLKLFRELFQEADAALITSVCEKLVATMDEVDEEIILLQTTKDWINLFRARTDYLKGTWQSAEDQLQKLLDDTENRELWATAATSLGTLHQSAGRLNDAIEWLRQSLQVWEELNDQRGVIHALNELGSAYRTNINLKDALKCYDRSYELAKNDPQTFDYERAYSRLYSGVIYTGQGKYDEASEAYRDALKIFEKLENRYGVVRAKQRLGWTARIRGRFRESETYHREALRDIEELGFDQPKAELLHSLGNTYRLLGEWDKALERFDQALALFESLGATRHIAILYNDRGWLYQARGAKEKNNELLELAIDFVSKSIELKRSLGQERETGSSLCSMGEIYTLMSRWDDAMQVLLESLTIARKIKVPINEARVLTALCELGLAKDDVALMNQYGALALNVEDGRYSHYVAQVHRVYGDHAMSLKDSELAAYEYAHSLFFAARYNTELFEELFARIWDRNELAAIDDKEKISFLGSIRDRMRLLGLDDSHIGLFATWCNDA